MGRRRRTPRTPRRYRVTFALSGEVCASETVVAETGTEAELIVARRHPDTVPRFNENLSVRVELVDTDGNGSKGWRGRG